MPFIAQSTSRIGDKTFVDPDPEEIHDDWEDVIDNYGEPEMLIPDTVWVVKASRDKPWHGYQHGDPILLISKHSS